MADDQPTEPNKLDPKLTSRPMPKPPTRETVAEQPAPPAPPSLNKPFGIDPKLTSKPMPKPPTRETVAEQPAPAAKKTTAEKVKTFAGKAAIAARESVVGKAVENTATKAVKSVKDRIPTKAYTKKNEIVAKVSEFKREAKETANEISSDISTLAAYAKSNPEQTKQNIKNVAAKVVDKAVNVVAQKAFKVVDKIVPDEVASTAFKVALNSDKIKQNIKSATAKIADKAVDKIVANKTANKAITVAANSYDKAVKAKKTIKKIVKVAREVKNVATDVKKNGINAVLIRYAREIGVAMRAAQKQREQAQIAAQAQGKENQQTWKKGVIDKSKPRVSERG